MDPWRLEFGITCLKCGSLKLSQGNYKCHRLEKKRWLPSTLWMLRVQLFYPLGIVQWLNSKGAHKPQTSTMIKPVSSSPTNSIRPLSFSVSPISVSVSVGPSSFTFSQPVSSSVNPTPLPIPSGMEASRTVIPGPRYVQSAEASHESSSFLCCIKTSLHLCFFKILLSCRNTPLQTWPFFLYSHHPHYLLQFLSLLLLLLPTQFLPPMIHPPKFFPFRMHCPGDFAYLLYLSTAHSFNLLTTEQQQIFSAMGASFRAQLAANSLVIKAYAPDWPNIYLHLINITPAKTVDKALAPIVQDIKSSQVACPKTIIYGRTIINTISHIYTMLMHELGTSA